jgi:hypothetical protein
MHNDSTSSQRVLSKPLEWPNGFSKPKSLCVLELAPAPSLALHTCAHTHRHKTPCCKRQLLWYSKGQKVLLAPAGPAVTSLPLPAGGHI